MPSLTIKHCLVCEDLRFEVRNIISFMGTYGITPDVSIRVIKLDIPSRLCFAFYGSDRSGTFLLTAQLRGPQGPLQFVPTPPAIQLILEDGKGPSFFAFWFEAAFEKPGLYKIVVFVDDVENFSSSFEVVRD